MSNAKSTSRSIYIDSTSAQQALDQLTKKAATLQVAIDGGTLSGDKLNKKIKELAQTKDDIQKVQDQVSKGLAPTFLQAQNQVTQLRNELKRMSDDAPGYAAKFDAYKKASATLSEMKEKIDGAKESQSGFGKIFEHVFEAVSAYRLIEGAFEKVKEFFQGSIEEANKAEQANARLENILQNIGRIDAFDRLKEKAHALSEEFKLFKADDVQEVFTKLITYGKLTEHQIDELTPVIVNFAEQQRISLTDATSVITKALEGNSRGLKEYGINIKDSSTVTERFARIMEGLAPRVAGAAEAFGNTTQGQIKKTQVQIEELQEKIGTELQPVIKGFYEVIARAIDGIEIIFKTAYDDIVSLGDAIAYHAKNIADIVTLDFDARKKRIQQHDDETRAIKESEQAQKDLANVQDQVNSFVSASAKKASDDQQAYIQKNIELIEKSLTAKQRQAAIDKITSDASKIAIDEQNKVIQQQTALRDASLKTQQSLLAQGKQNTDEFKKASLQYISDFQTVEALQKSLNAQQDKRVLGLGNPDDDPNAQKKYDELLKAAEEFNKKLRDLQNESANANKTADQKEIDNIKHKYDEIVIAYEAMQKKLKGTNIHLALTIDQIKGLEDAEIAATIRKQMRAIFDASQKEFDAAQGKQYADALAQSDKHFSELKAAQAKQFIDGTIDYKEYQNNITAIDEQSNAQKIAIAIQYTAFSNQAAADVTKFQKTQLDQQTKDAVAAFQKQMANAKELHDLEKQTALQHAQTAVDVAMKGSEQEYSAKKNYIDLEKQQALKSLEDLRQADLAKVKDDENRAGERVRINDAINQQIADANAKFDDEQKKLHQQHIKELTDTIAGYAQQVVDIAGQFGQAATNKDNAALNAEVKRNDATKAAFKKMLDGKLLTQSQYNAKVAALDADVEKKKQDLEKKEFERNKRIQIAQALINAAQASVKIWADPGFPLAIGLQALIAAQLAASISTISSQKPQFELGGEYDMHSVGGKLKGPAHSDKSKGMPVSNPYTGEVQAFMEGGEGILKKTAMASNQNYTVSGTPSQIASTLNNMHGGVSWDAPATVTRTFKPMWQNRSYQAINYPVIESTFVTKRFYESGGVFKTAGNDQPATGNAQTVILKDEETKVIMMAVLDRLNNPVVPVIKNEISLKQIKDADAQQARIVNDAALR